MVVPIKRNGVQARRYSEFLAGKRVIVVGPAGYLLGKGLGQWIDDHDLVVRLNWGAPVPANQKDDLGSRTDILYKRLLKLGHIDFIDLQEWYSEKMQWVIAVDRGQQNNSQRYFETMMSSSSINYTIERTTRNELHRDLNTSPFVGIVAISHLLRHQVASIDVVGMDFYSSGYSPGYGGREYREHHNRKEGTPSPRHNIRQQMKWLIDTAKSDGRLHFDEVLTEILREVPAPEKLIKGPNRQRAKTIKPQRRNPVPVLGVIPARWESSRFPGKPLAEIHGKPLILWTCQAVSRALEHFVVATDDPRIFQVVSDAGYQAVMTGQALTGTDRVAEVAKEYRANVFIDIQGDEPLVDPNDIAVLIKAKKAHANEVIVGVHKLSPEEAMSETAVKVAMTESNRVLYASRSLIPGTKGGDLLPGYWKHTGLVAFTDGELKAFAGWKRKSGLEAWEDVETLRFLELGIRLRGVEVLGSSQAVDVPEDVHKVEELMMLFGHVPNREAVPA